VACRFYWATLTSRTCSRFLAIAVKTWLRVELGGQNIIYTIHVCWYSGKEGAEEIDWRATGLQCNSLSYVDSYTQRLLMDLSNGFVYHWPLWPNLSRPWWSLPPSKYCWLDPASSTESQPVLPTCLRVHRYADNRDLLKPQYKSERHWCDLERTMRYQVKAWQIMSMQLFRKQSHNCWKSGPIIVMQGYMKVRAQTNPYCFGQAAFASLSYVDQRYGSPFNCKTCWNSASVELVGRGNPRVLKYRKIMSWLK
jgi:hypothetical protein